VTRSLISGKWPRRASSAICYLDAAVRARKNLTIVSQAQVTGITFAGRQLRRDIGRAAVTAAGATPGGRP